MLTTPLIGSLLIVCGIVYMAGVAVFRGRMSEPRSKPDGTPTLEPRRRTLGFLGVRANWPGLAMIVVGVVLLLMPPAVEEAPQVDEPATTEGAATSG